MDYLQRMNAALDYIETNLDGELNYKIAASKACCSVYYFQRLFSFVADIPLSEYVRRRRMTLAAFELQNSSIKIIDLALKYGYESPDAFTRAFQSLHGVTPSAVRSNGVSLKAYPRISFHISIKGDVEMDYRIVKKGPFRIVGIKKQFKAPDESGMVIPQFWNEIYQNGTFDVLSKLSDGDPQGVHGFIQVYGEDRVDYTIGCVSDKEPPKGMVNEVIPESTWAVFEINGPVNPAMAEAWKRIFTEWLPASGYKHAETTEIECFPYNGDKRLPDYKFEIWIPVVKA